MNFAAVNIKWKPFQVKNELTFCLLFVNKSTIFTIFYFASVISGKVSLKVEPTPRVDSKLSEIS